MAVMASGRDIRNRVPDLLEELAAENPMVLVRKAGLAQGTAYRLADRGEVIEGIQFKTLASICEFFTMSLGRKIDTDDVFPYQPEEATV